MRDPQARLFEEKMQSLTKNKRKTFVAATLVASIALFFAATSVPSARAWSTVANTNLVSNIHSSEVTNLHTHAVLHAHAAGAAQAAVALQAVSSFPSATNLAIAAFYVSQLSTALETSASFFFQAATTLQTAETIQSTVIIDDFTATQISTSFSAAIIAQSQAATAVLLVVPVIVQAHAVVLADVITATQACWCAPFIATTVLAQTSAQASIAFQTAPTFVSNAAVIMQSEAAITTSSTVATSLITAATFASQASLSFQSAAVLMSQSAVAFQSGAIVTGVGFASTAATNIFAGASLLASGCGALGTVVIL